MLRDMVRDFVDRGVCVVSPDDLVPCLGSKSKIYVYLNRLMERGVVERVMRGKYALCDDAFAVASQLFDNSYLSFSTALYLQGEVDQVVNELFSVHPGRRKDLKVLGTRVHYVHFSSARIFGFSRQGKRVVADLEKAVVDILYMPRYCGVSPAFDALESCDAGRLVRYARRMDQGSVLRRLGFLMDRAGIKHSIEVDSRSPIKLNPSLEGKGDFDPRWRIYVNEVVG